MAQNNDSAADDTILCFLFRFSHNTVKQNIYKLDTIKSKLSFILSIFCGEW